MLCSVLMTEDRETGEHALVWYKEWVPFLGIVERGLTFVCLRCATALLCEQMTGYRKER